MKYSFEIIFDKHDRSSPFLEDVQGIFVSKICIVAKKQKFGKFYFSKYIKKSTGKFRHSAGSNAYPILFPVKQVILFIENFPSYPVFTNKIMEHKPFLKIKNIKQFSINH